MEDRIRALESKIDALLMASITGPGDTLQTVNRASGLTGGPSVDPRIAMLLDQLVTAQRAQVAGKAVKKRKKVSAYARRYGAAYKRLRKKHPRAQHRTLVKKAHAEAKRGGKKR